MEYVANTLNPVFHIRNLYTVHYFKYAQGFRGPGEKHPFWELVYIDGGEADIIADDATFALAQGNAVFHKPNEYHNIFARTRYAHSVIVSFECNSRAMNFFKNRILPFDDYEKELLNRIVLEASRTFSDKLNRVDLLKMSRKANVPFGAEQIIKNCIELLLVDLVRKHSDNPAHIADVVELKPSNKIVADIVAYLKSHLYDTATIEDVANELYFSKTYVKRMFAEQMNAGIMQYYNSLKLEEAKKLLAADACTVTEIANRLGFSSIHYFSRAFKQHTGMSPTQYARSTKLDLLLD